MRNILYIGMDITTTSDGGDVVNLRNIDALKTIYGDRFHLYPLIRQNKASVMYNLLIGNAGFIRHNDYHQIISYILRNNITDVFLWSSKLGKLARSIKKHFNSSVRIITFFHNVEQQYYNEELKTNKSIKNRFIAKVVIKNEKLSTHYSDILITLNKRDSSLLEKYYNKNANFYLPTSFEDKYSAEKALQYSPFKGNQINLLFVGSSFFANNEGIAWFIQNVLPNIKNGHLTIVGKNMNKIFSSSDNITVNGFVEDLAQYYYQTDVVVQPIFLGGGMKTKMAEALMYGCAIVGTSESFEGYELENNKLGGLANDASTMTSIINHLTKDSQNILNAKKYAREIFNHKYNIKCTLVTLKQNLEITCNE